MAREENRKLQSFDRILYTEDAQLTIFVIPRTTEKTEVVLLVAKHTNLALA